MAARKEKAKTTELLVASATLVRAIALLLFSVGALVATAGHLARLFQ